MHRDGKGVNPREHGKLCDRGVGKCSQQRGNLKDDGYITVSCKDNHNCSISFRKRE
ncbi:hypothetical protein [Photorhabdus sp. RW14-46]|uniref:hypothetical protein n=1 Tax=Photorhabdus sp. RW14-46 TaxID=2100168 RepID=UPI0013F4A831|nr:hypothetical protein [Photorhabdus sp. RW14-46]